MTEKTTSLYAKLLKAQTAATAVTKQGRNTAQGYDYARAEDVIREAQRALHEAGLVGYMRSGEMTRTEITSQSGSSCFVNLEAFLVIADPDADEPLTIPFHGTGVDYPGDKAVYKAMTGAAKYAYASVLGIPFGDDPENEQGQTERVASQNGEAATAPQKRAVTTIMRRHNVADLVISNVVHAIAGDPPTKQGMSVILDRIADRDAPDDVVKDEIGKLIAEAGAEVSDIPGDAEGLPLDERAQQEALGISEHDE